MIEVIRLLSIVSVLPALAIYLSKYKSFPSHHHTIGVLLIICLVFDVILAFTSSASGILSNLQDITQLILLSTFFYQMLFQRRSAWAFLTLSGGYLIFLVYAIYMPGITAYQTSLWAYSAAAISVYAILYICLIPSMIIERFLDKHLYSNIIICSALLLYFLSSIFLFVFTDFVFGTLTRNEIVLFWSIHNTVNILKNVGLTFGLYLSGKRKTYITLEQLEKMSKPQPSELE